MEQNLNILHLSQTYYLKKRIELIMLLRAQICLERCKQEILPQILAHYNPHSSLYFACTFWKSKREFSILQSLTANFDAWLCVEGVSDNQLRNKSLLSLTDTLIVLYRHDHASSDHIYDACVTEKPPLNPGANH